MKSIALALAFITLLSIPRASSSWAAEQGNLSMDNATRTRIVTAAVAAAAKRGGEWQAADVGVEPAEIPGLDRNGCIFMVAINNTHVKDFILLYYALLPDGRIAGADITGNAAAATVLRVCSQQADANWWADVVACLSEDATGVMPVIYGVPNVFADLVRAGLDVKPPTLARSEGATTVEFFARPLELQWPLHIKATLPDQGDLMIIVKRLRPPGPRDDGE